MKIEHAWLNLGLGRFLGEFYQTNEKFIVPYRVSNCGSPTPKADALTTMLWRPPINKS